MKGLDGHRAALLILIAGLGTFCLAGCRQESASLSPGPLSAAPLPVSMKGYELYSWRSGKTWRYTLLTGSNRRKTVAEVTSGESKISGEWVKITVEGVTELEAVLDLLPSGATVLWAALDLPSGFAMPWMRLALPPESTIEAVRVHCAQQDIQLEVLRYDHVGWAMRSPEYTMSRRRSAAGDELLRRDAPKVTEQSRRQQIPIYGDQVLRFSGPCTGGELVIPGGPCIGRNRPRDGRSSAFREQATLLLATVRLRWAGSR